MVVADISSLWTPSIYAPKSQVDNNGLTVAEVTKKNSNRDTLRYDLCCCQDNHFCYDCYQFVIKRLIEIAETRINTGFFKQLDLFKLQTDSTEY